MELYRTDNYLIRHAQTMEELIEVERMQIEVWGITNHIEIVPKDILLIVQKNGGLVLVAFDFNGRMLGFLFGFIGRTADGQFKHCSHMMGVLASHRHLGIGEQLKWAQRKAVLDQGLDLITWTVSPLEGVNATLNFGKLGVICKTILPNFYGDMEDDLNKGLPSDRFEVEWWLSSDRVRAKATGQKAALSLHQLIESGARLVNTVADDGHVRFSGDWGISRLLVAEMPPSIQSIKTRSLPLAKVWIDLARGFFVSAFAEGYVVTDFFSEMIEGRRRNFYVLELTAQANRTN